MLVSEDNVEGFRQVFERGLKAIPFSVDLWIHYLNYCKATFTDNEDLLRSTFEKALEACGLEFRWSISQLFTALSWRFAGNIKFLL